MQRTVTTSELQSLRYAFNQPFQLQLAEGDILYAEHVLRLIPTKRMVVFGIWRDKSVVAKIFFDTKHAKRHVEKEEDGFKVLQENNVPTPKLYHVTESKDKHVQVLLFERIYQAKTLEELWRERTSVQSIMPQLQSIVTELATQHVLGIVQKDLHLKNFLMTEKVNYMLDAGQLEHLPHLLDKKSSMDNLALFLSQLGVGVERYQEELFLHYAKTRAWIVKLEDTKALAELINSYNIKRWHQYRKKIFRDCTQFATQHTWSNFTVYDREYAGEEFMQFLTDPELAFNHATTTVLKAGGSSTVVKVILDDRTYVVKRYNLKTVWHRLRRMLRVTRAVKSWCFANKLRLFYVPTPRPVACIEKRCLGLRGKSYFVMEPIEGVTAKEWFQERSNDAEAVQRMVNRILAILYNLARLDITHGDLKLTNLLINALDQPYLIDFDGATEHASLTSLRSGWDKEVARFLENFQHSAMLMDIFQSKLK